jgi:hypothetical protein
MIPGLSFIAPPLFNPQLSLADAAMIGPDGPFNSYTDTWKRSFLIGASTYKTDFQLVSRWTPGKETFFQKIQVVLGVAELAGVAYLGYKAIKKEPITKKK